MSDELPGLALSEPAPGDDQIEQLKVRGRVIRDQISGAIAQGDIDRTNQLHDELVAIRQQISERIRENQAQEGPQVDPYEPLEDVHPS